MRIVDCFHPVPCAAYCFWTVQAKLKEEYKTLSGDQIAKLRKSGVEITAEVENPMFVFMGDTSTKVFEVNEYLFPRKNNNNVIHC